MRLKLGGAMLTMLHHITLRANKNNRVNCPALTDATKKQKSRGDHSSSVDLHPATKFLWRYNQGTSENTLECSSVIQAASQGHVNHLPLLLVVSNRHCSNSLSKT